MPTSKTGTTKRPLPGLDEQATAGKEGGAALGGPPTQATHAAPRRTKALEDVDSDYAEEAEDFFYGEGR